MGRACLAFAVVALCAPAALAVPRRAPGATVRRAPARRVVRPAPRPALDLQVSGLAAGERRFHAVLHAIHRDAMPGFAACLPAAPAARGIAALTLTPSRRGPSLVELRGALPAPLAECLRAAATRVVLPPRELVDDEAPTPDEGVRFEVRVRLPAVGAR